MDDDKINTWGLPEALLDTKNDDGMTSEQLKVMKVFFDLAMPVVSDSGYKCKAPFELVSDLIRVSEETFAYLLLESNIQRWISIAKLQLRDDNEVDEEGNGQEHPNRLYQKNVKPRSDGRESAGIWLDIGLERFNRIAKMVQDQRKNGEFDEERLKELYLNDEETVSAIPSLRAKRKAQEMRNKASNSKKRVTVVDLFAV